MPLGFMWGLCVRYETFLGYKAMSESLAFFKVSLFSWHENCYLFLGPED